MPAKPSTSPLDRRRFLQVGAGVLGTSLVAPSLLAACGKSGSGSSSSAASTTTTGSADLGSAVGGPKLLAAAKADGTMTTAAIGTPNSYYVPVVDAFQKYAGFDVNVQKANIPTLVRGDDLAKAKQAGAKPPYDVVELTADGAAAADPAEAAHALQLHAVGRHPLDAQGLERCLVVRLLRDALVPHERHHAGQRTQELGRARRPGQAGLVRDAGRPTQWPTLHRWVVDVDGALGVIGQRREASTTSRQAST